jgi:hypothetical protein
LILESQPGLQRRVLLLLLVLVGLGVVLMVLVVLVLVLWFVGPLPPPGMLGP